MNWISKLKLMFFVVHSKMVTNNGSWQMGYIWNKKYFKDSTLTIFLVCHTLFLMKSFIKMAVDVFP